MMRTMSALLLWGAWAAGQPAPVEPPEEAPEPPPGYTASQETIDRFEALREKKRRPPKWVPPAALSKKGLKVRGVLYSLVDDLILVGVPISPAQEKVLLQRRAARVETKNRIRNHSIYEDRYYRGFRLEAEDVGGAEAYVGEEVEVTLERRAGDQALVAVSITRAR